ncbi:hypothetical protein EYZ11_000940 [Aspergillus tanneri]|uniref:Phosphatidate phosphatase APP1 catalytic domain-containing protein n=1 Tax=Aspergillus tanneri TaxID=1220188 RepID=A0A4S3JVV6_9EURO|nr:hypothetical protein EYZ11_000940 [Aspergillus tanneri]
MSSLTLHVPVLPQATSPALPSCRPTLEVHLHRIACEANLTTLAPKPPLRNRWRLFLPTSLITRQSLGRPFPSLVHFPSQPRRTRQGKFSLVLCVLFGPHASRRVLSRLRGLRYETIPALRHRAQARVYRAIVQRQARIARRHDVGRRGIVGFFTGKRRQLRGIDSGAGRIESRGSSQRSSSLQGGRNATNAPPTAFMSQYLPSSSSAPGGRRKKVYEYLKAANELRQSYAAQWAQQRNGLRDYSEDYLNTPGAFPDVDIARSGDEEMVIFPSYARRLVKARHARQRRGSTSTIDEYRGVSEEEELGLGEWEMVEDENAIVAVDVRGWVYSPHRGPMTRKHRLMVALARKLSGVPAPSNPSNDIEESGAVSVAATPGGKDDELVDTEAQSIIRKAEGGVDLGLDGGTLPGRSSQRTATSTSMEPPQMSKDEISVANAHLMERLRPFLTNPMTGMAVTVFFFNDGNSQSRRVMTDESGHFVLRAALPFIPTHIRVLASEDLSVMKPVEIIEPSGVSLISDIDDTVKHSAIASGAKEIFRNTFVRELSELAIHGVPEWYNKLAKMGVEVHYVSNAPWQLYPLLERYFKLVGLPPGSVHLKQYSGMLQGIFEPTAERKKGSLEQILRDFPERKFILIGDSGEADLEVYTDIVLANPGRILGVFIRDVTTPDRKRFFEKSVDHLETPASRSRSAIENSDSVSNRPALPPRRPRESSDPSADTKSLDEADLIDLRDEEEQERPLEDITRPSNTRTPPAKPSKPSSLRAVSINPGLVGSSSSLPQEAIRRKPVPPLPPRRNPPENQSALQRAPEENPVSSANSLPTRPKVTSDRNTAGSPAFNDGRPIRSKQPPPPPPPPRRSNTSTSISTASLNPTNTSVSHPSSQKQQSYPATAATAATTALQYASGRLSWAPSPSNILRSTASNTTLGGNSSDSDSQSGLAYPNSSAGPLPNKREEIWRRRWERAHDILSDQGVVLGSWRDGRDAQDVSVWLVEQALKEAWRPPGP